MALATDKIDERGNTLQEALEAYPSIGDWALATEVNLATSAAADDIIDTATPHGYVAGEAVRFTALTGGAGLDTSRWYYVVATSLAASTFRVALTPGGAAIGFTSDITAGKVATLAPAASAGGATGREKMYRAQSAAEVAALDTRT